MRRYARRAVAALAITVALAVTGCVATPGGTKPTPSPSATPLFHSDEEALAAAEEAYAAYQQTEDEIFADGGRNGERIEEVATGEALEAAKTGFSNFIANGYRSVGTTGFDSMKLQQYSDQAPEGSEVVTVYVCLDFSTQDVLDRENNSVVAPNRSLRQPFQVGFVRRSAEGIVMASRAPWTGVDTCED
jgi:hypothetical protein